MYICICNSVNQKAIHAAVEDGVQTFAQLQMATRAATCCGQCTSCAKEALYDALEAKAIREWDEAEAA
ncbi:hypothetical protein JCM19000A_01600 [Silvimonas sp. JCM 19000]